MQEDLSRIAELRQSIAADYAQIRDSAAKFATAHASLLDRVPDARVPPDRRSARGRGACGCAHACAYGSGAAGPGARLPGHRIGDHDHGQPRA